MIDLEEQGITTEFIDANDLRFEVLCAGNPESDHLALLLHGFPESAFSWRYQMPLLAQLGYRVWAPNQRGYGRTTRPLGKQAYRIEHLLADVAALIDRSGAKKVTLVAHDWGGIVAWAFAIQQVRPLERLVMMNIPHPTLFRQALRGWTQRRKSWYALFFQIPRLPEWVLGRNGAEGIGRAFTEMAVDKSKFPDEVVQVYRDNAKQPGALTAMIHWYRANFFGNDATSDDPVPLIETPTLMIWGEEDAALGKELTYGTGEFVPELTLRYLPRVSHWVQQEAPEEVNAIVEAWLLGKEVPYYDRPGLEGGG